MKAIRHKLVVGLIVLLLSIPLSGARSAETPDVGANGTDCGDISSPATLPTGSVLVEKIIELPGLKNVGKVTPNIYRGAQPEETGYMTLKEMGIKTVINLRTTMHERDDVEAAGMKSIEIPMNVLRSVDREKVDAAVDIMADPEYQPVFVHCKLGQDRTGIVVAAYRMKEEHWTPEKAEAEMQEFGFNDFWIHLKSFLRDYADNMNNPETSGSNPQTSRQ